jgi:hypothetical protein
MKVWDPDTLDGIIYWKPSQVRPVIDSVNGCYIVRTKSWPPFFNLDKEGVLKYKEIYRIITPHGFQYKHHVLLNDKGNSFDELMKDTIFTELPYDSTNVLKSFARKDGKFYYAVVRLSSAIKDSALQFRYHDYNIPREAYREFTFSDTLVKVRFKGIPPPEKVGFYFPDFREFIPFENMEKDYFSNKKIRQEYQLAIIKNNKLYAFDDKKGRLKTKKRKKAITIKVKKSTFNQFRWINTFNVRMN